MITCGRAGLCFGGARCANSGTMKVISLSGIDDITELNFLEDPHCGISLITSLGESAGGSIACIRKELFGLRLRTPYREAFGDISDRAHLPGVKPKMAINIYDSGV